MDDLKDNLLKFHNFYHNKVRVINFLFLIFFSIPLIIFLINLNFTNDVNVDSSSNTGQASGCRIHINNESYVDTNITNYPIDIYIFPEVDNLKCLGAPYVANYSVDGETLNIEYKVASNYKLFRYSSNIGNYLLILLLIMNKKRLIYLPVLIYFVFNLGIYNLFIPTEPISEIFFPVAPFYGERFVKFFVNNLFLIFLSFKIDSNKVYLGLFTFFCFISVDFVGIFIFLLFFKNFIKVPSAQPTSKTFLSFSIKSAIT